jgi:hypothetical protein
MDRHRRGNSRWSYRVFGGLSLGNGSTEEAMSDDKKPGSYSFISRERLKQILNNPQVESAMTMNTNNQPFAKVELARPSTKSQYMFLWDIRHSRFISARKIESSFPGTEVKDGIVRMSNLPIVRIIVRAESQSEAFIIAEEAIGIWSDGTKD